MRPEARWFEVLSPPPGGAARLRRALREDASPRPNLWRPVLAACVLGLAVGLMLRWDGLGAEPDLAPAITRVAQSHAPPQQGWLELPDAGPDVRLYLAMQAPPEPSSFER